MRILMLIGLILVMPVRAETMTPETFSPQSMTDARIIYLDFWASWCVPCRRSFPWLNAMQARYGDKGLRIIGINVDREREDANKFLSRYPAEFDLVMDPQGVLAEKYQLRGMPSAVVITPDGRELHRHIGFRADREDEYEEIIVQLLEQEE
ncbi:MAG: TlpA disulfide reductase family protein [Alcanivoracaceae bacterium]|jgi:thiol-disulfide isomerase/thioredoxin|nr:TlpA disulfide reductase family protein [Alcanivoracaceae bacterium]